jgi:hypothetical protein
VLLVRRRRTNNTLASFRVATDRPASYVVRRLE